MTLLQGRPQGFTRVKKMFRVQPHRRTKRGSMVFRTQLKEGGRQSSSRYMYTSLRTGPVSGTGIKRGSHRCLASKTNISQGGQETGRKLESSLHSPNCARMTCWKSSGQMPRNLSRMESAGAAPVLRATGLRGKLFRLRSSSSANVKVSFLRSSRCFADRDMV